MWHVVLTPWDKSAYPLDRLTPAKGKKKKVIIISS
jgi:hypothetical protein